MYVERAPKFQPNPTQKKTLTGAQLGWERAGV